MATKKGKKVVIAKKAYLEMVQNAFAKALEGGPAAGTRLSRERAATLVSELDKQIVTRAREGAFSVRGQGSFYTVTGKTGNEYFRHKRCLKRVKAVKK